MAQTTLLDKLLDGKPDEFKRKVFELVARTGYTDFNDPLFVILISTGSLQVLLNEKPAELEALFNRWASTITKSLDLVEAQIVERQKAAIAEAAGDLIRKAERQEATRLIKSVLPGACAAAAVLVVGFIAGMTVPPMLKGGYVAGEQLSVSDVETLRWASSKEGQYARNLMRWNADYLKVCESDTAKIPVKLSLGQKEAVNGFCLLWTQPPEKRKFQ